MAHWELGAATAGAMLLVACGTSDGTRQTAQGAASSDADPCLFLGSWIEPGHARWLNPSAVNTDMAARPVVLLGESHTNPEDHHWQHQTLVALYTLNPNMVVGFEMFPREKQAVLDRWVAGELSEPEFLEAVEWNRVWGYEPSLYLPLLRFVRNNRVPAIALNVERDLVRRVGDEGWASIPEGDREGIGDPLPALPAYEASLAAIYAHSHPGGEDASGGGAGELAFQRFVQAQLTWDRAMAEALVAGRRQHDASLAVGIIGRGHVENGHGVAHQLEDLGVPETGALLPVPVGEGCSGSDPLLADALFTVPEWQPNGSKGLTLGVYLEDSAQGVRILKVVPGSVAEAAGIEIDDLVIEAAGSPVAARVDLVSTIRRQAPGTWLPITVRRNGANQELIARFPPK